jgi:hypothetical protein
LIRFLLFSKLRKKHPLWIHGEHPIPEFSGGQIPWLVGNFKEYLRPSQPKPGQLFAFFRRYATFITPTKLEEMKFVFAVFFSLYLSLPAGLRAQSTASQLVPDFAQLFLNLDTQPTRTLFLRYQPSFDPSGGHLQGIQRIGASGIYLSGSTETHSYMALGDTERKGILAVDSLMPAPYRHAGGFQIYRHYLAVGIEDNQKRTSSQVQIYDLHAAHPWAEPRYSLSREGAYERVTAGAVGLTAYQQKIWLLVANWDSRNLDIYTCPEAEFEQGTGSFDLVISLDTSRLPRSDWSDPDWNSYQNINLFTDQQERLYLVGTGSRRRAD